MDHVPVCCGKPMTAAPPRYSCALCGLSVEVLPCEGDGDPPGTLPGGPCPFPAGSEEKILAMILRARLGMPLFHWGDSTERLPPHDESNRSNGRTLPRGISRHKSRWKARITREGKRVYLGLFDTAELAARAIEAAACAD